MRSPLNGALGIKLTDSPLAHGIMSVLLPQPRRGLALIYAGMVSGSKRWKEWNEIQEHLLPHFCYLITQGTLCWRSQGISVPCSGPLAAMFCLVCGLLRPSPTCLCCSAFMMMRNHSYGLQSLMMLRGLPHMSPALDPFIGKVDMFCRPKGNVA